MVSDICLINSPLANSNDYISTSLEILPWILLALTLSATSCLAAISWVLDLFRIFDCLVSNSCTDFYAPTSGIGNNSVDRSKGASPVLNSNEEYPNSPTTVLLTTTLSLGAADPNQLVDTAPNCSAILQWPYDFSHSVHLIVDGMEYSREIRPTPLPQLLPKATGESCICVQDCPVWQTM